MIVKDLSQVFSNGMPHATTIPTPHFEQVKSIPQDGLSVTQLSVASHVGTHLDAPCHFIEGGLSIDQISPEVLVGPAVAVSVEAGKDGEISAEDIQEAGVKVEPGDALLIRTGWGAKFGSDEYHQHPYLSKDCARWIVEKQVRLVGVDTITPDMPGHLRPTNFDFPVHHLLLGNGVLIAEHLYLEEVAGKRFNLFVGSLKVAHADGAPARILAVFEQ